LVPHEPPARYEEYLRGANTGAKLILICRLSDEAPGLVPWLIVRNQRFATGTHWRYGVLLRNDYGSHGLFILMRNQQLQLTVTGGYPAYFFHVLRDTFEELCDSRWPGLSYELLVPCRGTAEAPCAGVHPVRTLEGYSERRWPTIICPSCFSEQDVHELLIGFPAETRSESQILERLDRIEASVASGLHRAEQSADGVRLILRALSTEVTDCPRLFVIEPVDRSAWNPARGWNARFSLQLICESPGKEHAVEPKYSFVRPREWFAKTAPYLRVVGRTVQLLAPIVGGVGGVVGNEAQGVTDSARLMQAVATAAREIGDEADSGDDDVARGSGLRAFRELLFDLDASKTFADLERVLTPTGEYLWVCPYHRAEYDPGLPRLPYPVN
jgi:internalin A